MTRSEREDHAAFVRSALERHEGPLLAYATALLRDRSSAEDVVQESFLKLCRQERSRVEPILAPWLYRVTRNGAIDLLRRRQAMPRTNQVLLDGEVGPSDLVERRDASSAALLAVEALPDDQREVTLLKFRHGMAYREIAEITGRTVSHVGVLLHEAIKTLRARLDAPRPFVSDPGGAR